MYDDNLPPLIFAAMYICSRSGIPQNAEKKNILSENANREYPYLNFGPCKRDLLASPERVQKNLGLNFLVCMYRQLFPTKIISGEKNP